MSRQADCEYLAFEAGGAIGANRFVKFGSSDTAVVQGAAATDAIFGISDLAAASTERVDVCVSGKAKQIVYGGTVTRGDLLTSDSTGRAVTAAPAAGANVRIGGIALVSGVVGDVGSILLSPGSLQGA